MRFVCVTGARPNFMKIAPIMKELEKYESVQTVLVHTGQHYDDSLSQVFFRDLGLPEPDFYLNVGSGSHAEQTAKIMVEFEKVLLAEKPDAVIVVGDVNSTLACSITASKLGIPVAHVEAGLRSFNWEMPEEINRIITDKLSTLLFTTSRSANANLRKEGILNENIYFVGNVMIDTLLQNKEKSEQSKILEELNLKAGEYCVLTLHRAENVDKKGRLSNILDAVVEVSKSVTTVMPVHPRTGNKIKEFGFRDKLEHENIRTTNPLGYLEFIKLVSNSKFVLTDSGGVQEETTILGVPCLTLRGETERPVTVSEGTNAVVGVSKERIIAESTKIMSGRKKLPGSPELWDGRAAERIVNVLINYFKHE